MSISNLLNSLARRLTGKGHRSRAIEADERSLPTQIQHYFASVPVVMYALEVRDGEPIPVWASDNVDSILGYPLDEVLESGWWHGHVHPDDLEGALRESESAIETGYGKHEYRFRRKDGQYIHINDESKRVTTPESGAVRIVGVWSDVTERVAAEARIREYAERLERAMTGTVEAISEIGEQRDPYTAGHQRRVGDLAAAIAAELGRDENCQRGLRVAGALHDIGKVSIPSEILSKPARLTAAEFELVKGHAEAGYRILKGIDFPWPVADVAHQHHERLDGSGYPRGLKGAAIRIEARIIAVADVVEAMATHRPYRAGLGIDKALSEIEAGAGTRYEPEVAAACVRLFRERDYSIPA